MSSGRSVNFDDLPIEIRVKVFSNLSKSDLLRSVAPVCRSWHELVWNPSLWRELSLVSGCEKGNRCVFDRVPGLRSLTLSYRSHQSRCSLINTTLSHIRKCKSLIELDLSHCEQLKTKHLKRFLVSSPSVRYLNLNSCSSLDDEAFEFVSQCTQLEDLNVSRCFYSSNEWIRNLTAKCPNLKAISFSRRTVKMIENPFICELVDARKETLEFLSVFYIESLFDSVSSCDRLDTLIVENATLLTENDLMKITNLRRLKHLKMSFCFDMNLTSAPLKKFFDVGSFENLIYLGLNGCSIVTNDVVESISQKCRRLKHLSLCRCDCVTDVGVKKILLNCLDLETLNLLKTNLNGSCFEVRPFPLKRLQYLNLNVINSITENFAVELSLVSSSLTIVYGFQRVVRNGIDLGVYYFRYDDLVRKFGRSVIVKDEYESR